MTGKDWIFTWKTAINAKYKDHIDPLGWEDIRSVTGNKYVVKVTFKRNFAAWRGLFAYVLPQHALAGTDMLTVWNDCICNPKKGNAPIGNGPFLLTRFDRGSGITLTAQHARLVRQAGEAGLDRVPLHHEHELRDPGDPLG